MNESLNETTLKLHSLKPQTYGMRSHESMTCGFYTLWMDLLHTKITAKWRLPIYKFARKSHTQKSEIHSLAGNLRRLSQARSNFEIDSIDRIDFEFVLVATTASMFAQIQ